MCVFALSFLMMGQEKAYDILGVETNPWVQAIYTMDTLEDAKTLNDVYARYPESWVEEYISVELSFNCDGIAKTARSHDDVLTIEQLELLREASFGCRVDLLVEYIPKNNLKNNPARTLDLYAVAMPMFEAEYPGGYWAMMDYIQDEIIDKLKSTKIEYAAIRFQVDENGQVVDPRVEESSADGDADLFMLDKLRNMPVWTPARNADGENIAQAFEFTIGERLFRCDYPIRNLRRRPADR